MKVTVQNILNALKVYDSRINSSDRIAIEDKFISELRQFCKNHSHNSEEPLDSVVLYELCKILTSASDHDLESQDLVAQLQNKIGNTLFLWLKALHRNGIYNWSYFSLVYSSHYLKLDSLANKEFFETLNLLGQGEILTNRTFRWLMSLNQEELKCLHRILAALEEYHILNVAFFPLFISYYNFYEYTGKFPNGSIVPNGYLGMDVSQDLVDALPSVTFLARQHKTIFSNLLRIIDSETLQKTFKLLENLDFETANPDENHRFFIDLALKGILTLDIFYSFLMRKHLVSEIKDFLKAVYGRNISQENKNLIKKHFDALVIFINSKANPSIEEYNEYLDLIRGHHDEFRTTYTPALKNLQQTDTYATEQACLGMLELNKRHILDENTFHAMLGKHGCEVVFKTKLILHLNRLRITLNKSVLSIIKDYSPPYALLEKISSMSQLEVENYFKSMDIEGVSKRVADSFLLKHDKTSFFFELPGNALRLSAIYRDNNVHNETATRVFAETTWASIPESSTTLSSISDIQTDKESDQPVFVSPKP